MTDNQNWLAAYAQTGSDAAFRELVIRHVDLVYSTALRLVGGDTHRAEDVAQTVFVKLARVAKTLPQDVKLGGWLHRDTCFTASTLMRGERRRQTRERQAAEMNVLQNNSEADYSLVAPVLDEAINELNEEDRTAILLRFYERSDFWSVGQALGSNEDAARMRVNRALEKLQELLKRRGLITSSAALAIVLSSNAVQAAPVGLAVTISTAAVLTGTTLATTATVTATKALAMTAVQKTIVTATIAVLAGAGIYQARQAAQLRGQVRTLEQRQAPLTKQITDLNQALVNATNQLAFLHDDNERLNRNTGDLLTLRAEVAQFRRDSRKLDETGGATTNDPTMLAAQSWANRVKTLKQRFEEWPGRKTPELQLLGEQDWLNEAAIHKLDSDEDARQAMSNLRWKAKNEFSDLVNKALTQFTKDNNQRLPTDPAELTQYLESPANACLANWQVAQPSWVHPPQPNGPNSEKAEVWALVEKGSFTPDGVAIRDGSYLADPNFDMTVVIYQGGCYAYGPDRPLR